MSANILQKLQDLNFKVTDFDRLLPELKSYWLEKCEEFCAGQVSKHIEN